MVALNQLKYSFKFIVEITSFFSALIPQYKSPVKKCSKVIKSILTRIITRREIQDKNTPISNLDLLLDLNTYADYCCVYGGDSDSSRMLYSFVNWKEDILLNQLEERDSKDLILISILDFKTCLHLKKELQ